MSTQLVRDVMTRYTVVVRPETGFREILETLVRFHVSAVPVIDDEGRLLGVVSEDDLMHKVEYGGDASAALFETRRSRLAKAKAGGETARDLMTSPAVTIAPRATVAEAAHRMHTLRVKRLPVVADDRLVGVVSRSDILRVFLRPDAEIQQEIEHYVLRRDLALDPAEATVRVVAGVATLSGDTDRRSTVEAALRLTRAVDGVVRVVNELRWSVDDTVEAIHRYAYR